MPVYNRYGGYGGGTTPTANFGDPYNPLSVMKAPVRNMDFYNKKSPGGKPLTMNPAYQGQIGTANQRSGQLYGQAQGNQPNLNWAPQDWASYQKMSGGAYPQLRNYQNFPTPGAAAPWMRELEGGQKNLLDEYIRRTAGAGISRGGMSSAGGPMLDSRLRNEEMTNLASLFGSNFQQGMGYAEKGAAWDRTKALDELSAQQRAADAAQQQLAQYFGLQGQQAGQQLSKYGADMGASQNWAGQGLAATNAGMGNAMDQLRMQQGAWSGDVANDQALMRQFPWLFAGGLGGQGQPGGTRGSAAPTRKPQGSPYDQNVLRNMDPNRAAQENQRGQAASRQKQQEDELAQYMRQFTNSGDKLAAQQKGLMNFNFNPYDYRMASRGGYQLPDQGKINYGMQSQTGANAGWQIHTGRS